MTSGDGFERSQSADRASVRRDPLLVEAASWPIEPASLAALIGIGMSDRQIAAYFSVAVADVWTLRDRFGLR